MGTCSVPPSGSVTSLTSMRRSLSTRCPPLAPRRRRRETSAELGQATASGLLAGALVSTCAGLCELRPGERGRLPLLSPLRGATRDRSAGSRAAQDGDGPVLRRDGLDCARRVDGSRSASCVARALLRANEGDRRGPWWHG